MEEILGPRQPDLTDFCPTETTMTDKLIIFDTTLRDGEQSPGASMTREEKLRIARQLERMKVDVIEAGFAASSNGDFEAVKAIAAAVKDSTICSLARANDRDISRAAEALRRSPTQSDLVFVGATRSRYCASDAGSGKVTVAHASSRNRSRSARPGMDVPAERGVDRALGALRCTPDQRQVGPLQWARAAVVGELRREVLVGEVGLGHHHQARGSAIQPMHDAGALRPPDTAQAAEVVEQRMDQRPRGVTGSWMHDHAGRLVDAVDAHRPAHPDLGAVGRRAEEVEHLPGIGAARDLRIEPRLRFRAGKRLCLAK